MFNGRGDPLRWPCDILCPQKLAPTSPTSGGLSVGIVRLRTKATEFRNNEREISQIYPCRCTNGLYEWFKPYCSCWCWSFLRMLHADITAFYIIPESLATSPPSLLTLLTGERDPQYDKLWRTVILAWGSVRHVSIAKAFVVEEWCLVIAVREFSFSFQLVDMVRTVTHHSDKSADVRNCKLVMWRCVMV
jgi:hypothetical protein